MTANTPLPPSSAPLMTIQTFATEFPDFTVGALRWLIFHKRDELLEHEVIRFWGKKVLIHQDNFFNFIMERRTENLRQAINKQPKNGGFFHDRVKK